MTEKNLIPSPGSLSYVTEIGRDPRLLSEHTRRAYRSVLSRFEAWRDGRMITETLVEAYLVKLREDDGLAPRSINAHLAVIRWWARRVSKLAAQYTAPEQAARIAQQAGRVVMIQDVKGSRTSTGRHIDNVEIVALLATCDGSPAGRRDAALLSIAWATGARIHEIRDLNLSDLTYTQDGADIVLHGKGDRDRQGYLYNGALDALNAWLDLRGGLDGPLFNPIRKDDTILYSRRLTLEGLRLILAGHQAAANLKKHLTWHDFRRTFIGRLFDIGTDISTAQGLAGHASPATTTAYDRRDDRRKREAVRNLAFVSLEIPKS